MCIAKSLAMCKCLCMANPSTGLDLIGSAEAAQLLGVDRATLTRWVKNGRIAAKQKMPGDTGAYLFDRAEVERVREAETSGRSA